MTENTFSIDIKSFLNLSKILLSPSCPVSVQEMSRVRYIVNCSRTELYSLLTSQRNGCPNIFCLLFIPLFSHSQSLASNFTSLSFQQRNRGIHGAPGFYPLVIHEHTATCKHEMYVDGDLNVVIQTDTRRNNNVIMTSF